MGKTGYYWFYGVLGFTGFLDCTTCFGPDLFAYWIDTQLMCYVTRRPFRSLPLTLSAVLAGEAPGALAAAVDARAVAAAVGDDALVVAQLALAALPARVAPARARLVVSVARAQHGADACNGGGDSFSQTGFQGPVQLNRQLISIQGAHMRKRIVNWY